MTVSACRPFAVIAIVAATACSGSTAATGAKTTAPAPAAVAPSPPKPFEYAASTGQYRFTSDTKGTQSAMGNSRDISSTSTRLMTIGLARSAPDTITMSLIIDSISTTNSMGTPTIGIEKVPGTKFIAKLAPNGVFYSATGPTEAENPVAAGMTDEIGRALPRLKATLVNGATWTDTLKDKIKQGTLDVNREIVTKYTVSGDSVVSGESSWKVLREMTAKGNGTGAIQGQAVTLESSGTGKGVLWVGKKGVLMAGSGEETSNGTVTLSAQGVQILIVSNTKTQFNKVK